MMVRLLPLGLVVVLITLLNTSAAEHVDSKKWKFLKRAHPSLRLPVTLALKIDDSALDFLTSRLESVSDPTSTTFYGQYVTNDEITEILSIPPSRINAVTSFLTTAKFDTITVSRNKDYVHAIGSVLAIETLFSVTMSHYYSPHNNVSYIRAGNPAVMPSDLEPHVETTMSIDTFPTVSTKQLPLPSTTTTTHNTNSPIVQAPTTWRGEEVYMMAVLKCKDGSFKLPTVPCASNAIQRVILSLDPVSESLPATAKIYKPYELFHSPTPSCKSCDSYKRGTFIKGQEPRELCEKMITSGSIPSDASFCLLSLSGAVLGAPSEVNVATVFAPSKNATSFLASVSNESECLAGQSVQNCSKTLVLMPDVTPSYIRSLYNVPTSVVGSPRTSQGVSAFLNEHFSSNDLASFLHKFNVPESASVSVIGPNDEGNPTGEASLDIQTILGVAPSVPTTFWSFGGLRESIDDAGTDANQEPFLKWMLQYNEEEVTNPDVFSLSYDDDEINQSPSFTNRLNVEFIKAGLLGRSLLFAAGDDGVGGQVLRTTGSSGCTKFRPEWPSTSPFVTSVGGTIIGRNSREEEVEVVSDVLAGSFITGGGGFSTRYEMPSYQKKSVKEFLSKEFVIPPTEFFNKNGRAYPDISAIATNYMIRVGEKKGFIPIAGTSASTPAMAGLVSLINSVRVDNGYPVLGFLNPLLYALHQSHPEVFNDVTSGNNKCSAVPECCCKYGFEATTGWDAGSGVGTPNVEKLLELLGNRLSPYITENTKNTMTLNNETDGTLETELSSSSSSVLTIGGMIGITLMSGFVLTILIKLRKQRVVYSPII